MRLPELNAGGVLVDLGPNLTAVAVPACQGTLGLLLMPIPSLCRPSARVFYAWFPHLDGHDPGHNPNLTLPELLSLCIIRLTAQHIYRLVLWRIAGVLGLIIKTRPRFNYWPTTSKSMPE